MAQKATWRWKIHFGLWLKWSQSTVTGFVVPGSQWGRTLQYENVEEKSDLPHCGQKAQRETERARRDDRQDKHFQTTPQMNSFGQRESPQKKKKNPQMWIHLRINMLSRYELLPICHNPIISHHLNIALETKILTYEPFREILCIQSKAQHQKAVSIQSSKPDFIGSNPHGGPLWYWWPHTATQSSFQKW